MSTTEKYLIGSAATLLSTELDSLANNSLAPGGAFDNTAGQAGDGYVLCDLELVASFVSSPGPGSGVSLWLLSSLDGTNYEDGDGSTTPGRLPLVVFPVRATASAQRVIQRAYLPWGKFKPLLKNDGTGQAFASSGNTLKLRPVTYQGV